MGDFSNKAITNMLIWQLIFRRINSHLGLQCNRFFCKAAAEHSIIAKVIKVSTKT